jgi:hypothetical protein
MKTPAEFLDLIRARYSLPSDYAVAQLLGVNRQLVSKWRQGHGGMGDDHALRVAQLLELDVGHVLARLYAERAPSDETRSVWLDLARRLGPAVAICLVALVLLPVFGIEDTALAGALPLCVMSSLVGIVLAAATVWLLTQPGDARTLHRAADRDSVPA